MIKQKWWWSLRAKMVYAMLLAGILGISTFFLVQTGSSELIDFYYLNRTAIIRRNEEHAQSLNQYVQENQVRSTDTKAIGQWLAQEGNLYLLLYRDESYAYGTGWWGVDAQGNLYRNNASADHAVFTIFFVDGPVTAEILDYSISRLYTFCDIASMAFACAVFTLVILLYNRYVTKSVIELSQTVRQVSGGNFDKEIQLKGKDELSLLARETDVMRRTILGRIQKEKMAYQANSDLLTAISHDIRTPLTALIGYLDLAAGGQYQSPEQLREYLTVSRDKAMQLKDLTEKLFQYFLAFGAGEEPMALELYDAQPVLEQLLGESVALLRLKGFRVHEAPLKESCRIGADMQYLKRVFDNLFSNVEKHADKSRPVVVMAEKEANLLRICISNWVPESPNPVESTKIGLKTCQKVMERLRGQLILYQEKSQFVAEVVLPLYR